MSMPLRLSRAGAALVPKEALKGKPASLIPVERFASRIYWLRKRQVMFDFDLADLYRVSTKSLNQAVTRNLARFPEDFMFRLSPEEILLLNRSQIVTGSQRHRDPKFPPRAFTQEGIAMLSGVLRSRRAIQVNLGIMRAFVRLREILASDAQLARKLEEHDRQIATLFEHVRAMLAPARAKKNPIGFILHKS
jgi:ORF6N domain